MSKLAPSAGNESEWITYWGRRQLCFWMLSLALARKGFRAAASGSQIPQPSSPLEKDKLFGGVSNASSWSICFDVPSGDTISLCPRDFRGTSQRPGGCQVHGSPACGQQEPPPWFPRTGSVTAFPLRSIVRSWCEACLWLFAQSHQQCTLLRCQAGHLPWTGYQKA